MPKTLLAKAGAIMIRHGVIFFHRLFLIFVQILNQIILRATHALVLAYKFSNK